MTFLLLSIRKYWIPITLFIFTAIAILSLQPLDAFPPFPGTDKTHHFIAYAALMFPTALRKPKHILSIGLLFVLCSGAIELIQPFVNRYGELGDLAANVVGLSCGFLLAQITIQIFPLDIPRQ